GKEVVGIAKVVKECYQDPTTTDDRWVVVHLSPVEQLKKPVNLETIKSDDLIKNTAMVKQSRLTVMPLKREEFDRIVELGSYDLGVSVPDTRIRFNSKACEISSFSANTKRICRR